MIKSLTFILLIFFQFDVSAEWVPIKYKSNKYDFFFDPSSKIIIDEQVNIWALIEDKDKITSSRKRPKSQAFLFSIKCKSRKYSINTKIQYKQKKGVGEIINEINYASPPEFHITPYSFQDIISTLVCS
jgi:hypothetical protein